MEWGPYQKLKLKFDESNKINKVNVVIEKNKIFTNHFHLWH